MKRTSDRLLEQANRLKNTGGCFIIDEDGHARRLVDIVRAAYPKEAKEIDEEDAEEESEDDTEG